MATLAYIFLIVALMECSNARTKETQEIINVGDNDSDDNDFAGDAKWFVGEKTASDDGYSVDEVDLSVSVHLGNPSGTWILVQHQRVGATTLFKTGLWKDYKSPFGSSSPRDAAFWMGLEHLHQLTSLETWKLAVKMKYKDGSFGFSVWNNFKVDGESNKYMMHLGGVAKQHNVKGKAWPLLLKNSTGGVGAWNGIKFSTTDSDNDNDPYTHCASGVGGGCGWWFDSCFYICLNCALPDYDITHPYGPVETIMAIQKV